MLCLQRYKCTFNDSYRVTRSSISYVILCLLAVHCTDVQYTVCSLLSECLRVRDGLLKLPDSFSQSDINDIITYLSRFYVGLFCVGFLCSFICLHVYISLYATTVFRPTVYFVFDFHNK